MARIGASACSTSWRAGSRRASSGRVRTAEAMANHRLVSRHGSSPNRAGVCCSTAAPSTTPPMAKARAAPTTLPSDSSSSDRPRRSGIHRSAATEIATGTTKLPAVPASIRARNSTVKSWAKAVIAMPTVHRPESTSRIRSRLVRSASQPSGRAIRAMGAAIARPWTRLICTSVRPMEAFAASCSGENTVRMVAPAQTASASTRMAPQAVRRIGATGAPSTSVIAVSVIIRALGQENRGIGSWLASHQQV